MRVLTELAELAIGNDQGSQSPQTLKGLVTVLLSGVLIDRCVWGVDRLGVELLCLPDEILQQVAFVLAQEEVLGLCYNIANIGHERLALSRQFRGGLGERLGREEAVQGDIDLIVLPI